MGVALACTTAELEKLYEAQETHFIWVVHLRAYESAIRLKGQDDRRL